MPMAANRTAWRASVTGTPDTGGRVGSSTELSAQVGQRQLTRCECSPEAGDPAKVGDRGLHDVDPAVGIVDPVDRHLVDAQPGALGEHQQLGVEEPGLVLDQRQQLAGGVGPDRLETALGVGEIGPAAWCAAAGCSSAR